MAQEVFNNPETEAIIARLESAVEPTETWLRSAMPGDPAAFPLVLRIGSSRSGSTLFTQWAAATGAFAYPSNIMAMFQSAPLLGAHIQALMTDPRLRRHGEFDDLYQRPIMSSTSGKTSGAAAPNEFWRFWLRYFEFPRTPVSEEDWVKSANFAEFVRDIELLIAFFGRPLLLKGHNLTHYLETFSQNVRNAVFVHMYRDPVDVIISVLRARITRYGDPDFFFGWRPPEYEMLRNHDRFHQVAGQVYFNERAIIHATRAFEDRCITFSYEDFCRSPAEIFERIRVLVSRHSKTELGVTYVGPESFAASRATDPTERNAAGKALGYWIGGHGPLVYRDGRVWD